MTLPRGFLYRTGGTAKLTRLSLKLLSFNAKLFQKSRIWSFSVMIFKASGADRGTAKEKKGQQVRLEHWWHFSLTGMEALLKLGGFF